MQESYNPPPEETTISPRPKVCTRLGKCTYCPLIKKISEVTCNYTNETFKVRNIPKQLTCELSNIIYVIQCSLCNMIYTGETGREFRKRIDEHKLSVKRLKENRSTPVSRHFTSDNHSHHHMMFSVIEWCTPKFEQSATSKRRRVEMYWIFKLHCLSPLGINQFV